MGPDAYRVAGIEKLLTELGHEVRDTGNLSPGVLPHAHCDNPAVDQLDETLGWTKVLRHRVAGFLAGGRTCRSRWAAIIRWRWVRSPARPSTRPAPGGRCF